MSTPPTSSTPGTPKPRRSSLEPTIPQRTPSPMNPTISTYSQAVSKPGEASSKQDPVKLPTPDEILEAKPPSQPRILKLTSDEFYQWRQILGMYKKQLKTQVLGAHAS
jgi:hypothetical protein